MWNLNPRQGSKNIMALSAEEVNGHVWKYGMPELIIILVIALIFLGGKASELGNTIGKAIRASKRPWMSRKRSRMTRQTLKNQ